MPPPSDPSSPPPDATIDSPSPPTSSVRHYADVQTIGPFRILERIGEGGMGVIYKAEQRTPVKRIVALKVIKLGMDSREVLARFDAERQALALMNHPNIARVLDAGMTDEGRPYFAMEFVPGVPLNRYCVDNKLSTRDRIDLLIRVCQAVQHAHQKGIIHRDLKPSNILVTLVDGGPVPKVIDFGIAKATSQALTQHTLYTQTGAIVGTPEYMSPEQALTSGLDVDTRTDIYSLGVILYELLTETLPFDPKQLREAGLEGMARMIRETEPPRPSVRLRTVLSTGPLAQRDTRIVRTELSGDLDWIVLKAMEKDRTRRYDTAAALAEDLRRHLEDEPVLARPPSTGYRVGKFVRRHKAGVVGAAAVAAALVLGVVGTAVGYIRARDQRDKARAAEVRAVEERNAAQAAREDARVATLFLRDLLSSFGDPLRGKPGVVQAMKRLDEGWLKDMPDVALSCRISCGFYQLMQGELADAERQLELAMALLPRLSNEPVPAVSGPVNQARGMVAQRRQDWPAAERYFRAALSDFEAVPGTESSRAGTMSLLSIVLDSRGKADEAAQLRRRAEALTPAVAGPATEDRTRLASEALSDGRFTEALPHLLRATQLAPAEHYAWYLRSITLLYTGDADGYRKVAGEMLESFGGHKTPFIAERTAKACLLMSTPVGEAARHVRDLDVVIAGADGASYLPWYRLSRALARCRAGQFDDAIADGEAARTLNVPAAQVAIDAIEAMAHHRANRPAEAKALLAKAKSTIEASFPKPGEAKINGPENFMTAHILHREAKALIEGK